MNEIQLNKLVIKYFGKESNNAEDLKQITQDIWEEAQKELLEEFQKEMYEQNVSYICDFEIQHKLKELTKENNLKNGK